MDQQPNGRHDLDTVNLAFWARREVVDHCAVVEGFTDAGERAALLSLAPSVRGTAMLDIGMGGGRTTTWSLLLTDDYIGIDITPEMVAAARARNPGIDLRVGDARDLSAFPDNHFGFVMFSFNGIDAVRHDERRAVLGEIRRVLKPGGHVLISTLNLDSAGFHSTPLHRAKSEADEPATPGPSANPHARRDRVEHFLNRGLRLAADPALPLRRAASWVRLKRLSEDHGSWAIAPLDAHAFGLLVHWTTLALACSEFEAAGLDVRHVFRSDTGARVPVSDWSRPKAVTCDCVHLVAQRGH